MTTAKTTTPAPPPAATSAHPRGRLRRTARLATVALTATLFLLTIAPGHAWDGIARAALSQPAASEAPRQQHRDNGPPPELALRLGAAADFTAGTLGEREQRDVFGTDRDHYPLGPLGLYGMPHTPLGIRISRTDRDAPNVLLRAVEIGDVLIATNGTSLVARAAEGGTPSNRTLLARYGRALEDAERSETGTFTLTFRRPVPRENGGTDEEDTLNRSLELGEPFDVELVMRTFDPCDDRRDDAIDGGTPSEPGADGEGEDQVDDGAAGGGAATDPPPPLHPGACPRWHAIQREALDWLADRQARDGGFPARLGATNGRVAASAMAGLAFLAAGSTTREGRYEENLAELVNFLRRECGEDPIARLMRRRQAGVNWSQTNWAWGFAGWFLAEALHAEPRDRRVARLLDKAVDELQDAQITIDLDDEDADPDDPNAGGWGHGPGEHANALGYTGFAAITALATTTLGLAARLERDDVEPDARWRALDYLRRSVDTSGGLAYQAVSGTYRWRTEADPGRSAIGWLALAANGEAGTSIGRGLQAHVGDHLDRLDTGHMGYAMQMVWTALAVRHDPARWSAFFQQVHPELSLARAANGRFRPRPTAETLELRKNNDHALGDAWTTAAYLIVLSLALDDSPRSAPTEGPSASVDNEHEHEPQHGDQDEIEVDLPRVLPLLTTFAPAALAPPSPAPAADSDSADDTSNPRDEADDSRPDAAG